MAEGPRRLRLSRGRRREQLRAVTLDRWTGVAPPARPALLGPETSAEQFAAGVAAEVADLEDAIQHFPDRADAELAGLVGASADAGVGPLPADPNLPELDPDGIAPLDALCRQARRLLHRAMVDGTVDPAWQGREGDDRAPRTVASRIAIGVVTGNPDLTDQLVEMLPGLKTSPVTLPTLRAFPAPVGAVIQEVERHLESEGELFGLWAPGKRSLSPGARAPRFSPGDFLDL